MLQNVKKRAQRRVWPIHGYVGANGGGKTAAMVWDTLPTLDAGRPVLSTVRLLDYDDPRECEGCDDPDHQMIRSFPIDRPEDVPVELWRKLPIEDRTEQRYVGVHPAAHPLWIPFTDWEQLMTARGCDVLMDEVTGVASSRESQSMPAPVANKLVQLRRADVVVRWSAPNWARADKIIRECSQAVTYCEGFMTTVAKDEGGQRMWRNRRLFKWKTYDAQAFEDFTVGKREALPSMCSSWHWGPKSVVFDAYDTFDAVLSIGTVSDAGRCYRCGGSRPVPKCRCDAHGDPRPKPEPVRGARTESAPSPEPVPVAGKRRALAVLEN